jgi:hypothetical protein
LAALLLQLLLQLLLLLLLPWYQKGLPRHTCSPAAMQLKPKPITLPS